VNSPCERCGDRPHSFFTDLGYLCGECVEALRKAWVFEIAEADDDRYRPLDLFVADHAGYSPTAAVPKRQLRILHDGRVVFEARLEHCSFTAEIDKLGPALEKLAQIEKAEAEFVERLARGAVR
jgi:hypothetical protein